MANIRTNEVTNGLATIIAQDSLATLRQRVQLARLISRDYAPEVASYGQSVKITKRGALSVNNKTGNSAVTLQTPSDSAVTVTLDKHKEVSFLIEDVAAALARPDYRMGYTSDAADRIAEAIESDLLALISGFSSSVGTASSDLSRTVITQAGQTLTTALAPQAGRFMIITPAQEQALLDTDNFSFADRLGSTEAVVEGSLGRKFGFDMYVNTLLPAGVGSPAGKLNFAGHRDAMTLVMRDLAVNEAPGVAQAVVRDEELGLSMRVTMSYSPQYLGVQTTVDVLYGVAELRDEYGVRVLSQD